MQALFMAQTNLKHEGCPNSHPEQVTRTKDSKL